jgi:hypothetical protein
MGSRDVKAITDRATLHHAAKLLALSLTDEMLDSLRADYGDTNVAVLRHWRAEVLALLDAETGKVADTINELGVRLERLQEKLDDLVHLEPRPEND